jgi:nucleoside-diphosphate kinase
MMGDVEKTLIVFKPDSVQRGLVGRILTRFEQVGLKIVARRGKEKFDVTLEMMVQGPVIAMVLEGVEAVDLVRKLVGATEPKSAAPGTIRGDFSHMSFQYADSEGKGVPNLIHASGNIEEAAEEISHWFSDDELYSYHRTSERFTR